MKQEIINVASKTGLNSEETLLYSQKLDSLITQYQKRLLENFKGAEKTRLTLKEVNTFIKISEETTGFINSSLIKEKK